MNTITIQEGVTTYHSKEVERHTITGSLSAYDYLKGIYEQYPDHHHQEHFFLVVLNHANEVLGFELIGIGGKASCIIEPSVVINKMNKYSASSKVILTHNHPSGRTIPSKPDIILTKKINLVCRIMDYKVLDHIIYTPTHYNSFIDSAITFDVENEKLKELICDFISEEPQPKIY